MTSPSSSAQGAREALAVRPQHLRKDAGLTGRELSARCGWHPAKTTRIQKGEAPPSDADIRTWCTACGADDQADDQADDLIATAPRGRLDVPGVAPPARQRDAARTGGLLRAVRADPDLPGLPVQRAAGIFPDTRLRDRADGTDQRLPTPNDVSEAVAARVARSRFLYEGGHRFVVLMEESVLRYRTADPEAMAGQLHHLLAVMPLASVSRGIIPFTARRTVWPLEAFYLHDDVQAVVETLTAEINVRQPRELADYAKAFTSLASMAVYGDAARALIRAAVDTTAPRTRRSSPPCSRGPPRTSRAATTSRSPCN